MRRVPLKGEIYIEETSANFPTKMDNIDAFAKFVAERAVGYERHELSPKRGSLFDIVFTHSFPACRVSGVMMSMDASHGNDRDPPVPMSDSNWGV